MQTGTPAARKGRATSITRGNWFDCTPAKPTSPRPPAAAIALMIASGRTRVLVSSIGRISTSKPSRAPRSIASVAMP